MSISLNEIFTFVTYPRSFVHITECVEGAVFLSQVYFSYIEEKEQPFHKTIDEWVEITGIKPDKLRKIRAHLKSIGILKETKKGQTYGVPCKIFYELNVKKIYDFISCEYKKEAA